MIESKRHSDKTYIYISMNQEPFEAACIKRLKAQIGDSAPLLAVTCHPVDIADNIVLGQQHVCQKNFYMALWLACAWAKTEYVQLLTESVLYPDEWFTLSPPQRYMQDTLWVMHTPTYLLPDMETPTFLPFTPDIPDIMCRSWLWGQLNRKLRSPDNTLSWAADDESGRFNPKAHNIFKPDQGMETGEIGIGYGPLLVSTGFACYDKLKRRSIAEGWEEQSQLPYWGTPSDVWRRLGMIPKGEEGDAHG